MNGVVCAVHFQVRVRSRAVPTATPGRSLSERNPASLSHFVETLVEGLFLPAGSRGSGAVHALEVLGEEIFAVGSVAAASKLLRICDFMI